MEKQHSDNVVEEWETQGIIQWICFRDKLRLDYGSVVRLKKYDFMQLQSNMLSSLIFYNEIKFKYDCDQNEQKIDWRQVRRVNGCVMDDACEKLSMTQS